MIIKKIKSRWFQASVPLVLVTILLLLSSCIITSVEQPETADAGETISVVLEFHTIYADENPHYGILGLLIPDDWTVESVTYDGDFGSGTASFLHPDSADGDPGGEYEYWADSLELHFPSLENMHWEVYQSDESHVVEFDTSWADVNIEMTVGETGGTYNIGYFVANGASEIQPPGEIIWYGISLENPIEITGGSGIKTNRTIPVRSKLSQNYPNPFNAVTQINFDLATTGFTTLKVYNLLGKEVASLVNKQVPAGSHSINLDANSLESGIYYYKIQSGDFATVKKFVLVK